MKNLIILIVLLIIPACTKTVTKNNDFGLQIDIYEKSMTYEKFKQTVIDYAENASYPILTSND
tara:strand:- start:253 stop:441 length:189 start_codon:yes stop_codon:yes gene_type:complete